MVVYREIKVSHVSNAKKATKKILMKIYILSHSYKFTNMYFILPKIFIQIHHHLFLHQFYLEYNLKHFSYSTSKRIIKGVQVRKIYIHVFYRETDKLSMSFCLFLIIFTIHFIGFLFFSVFS